MTQGPWPLKPLLDVVDLLDSQRVPVKAADRTVRPGDVPYYGATGQVGFIDRPLFDEPLLLLGEDGVPFLDPYKPKAYLIDGPAWVNNHAHVIRVREGLLRPFLLHALNSFDYRGHVNGTTRLKLTQAAMRSMTVPVPDLGEQRQIVEILESHLSHLDAADASLALAMGRAGALLNAELDAAVWGDPTPTVQVGSLLAEPMRNGRSDRAVEGSSGTRTLTLTAVTKREFSDRYTKLTSTPPKIAEGLWLRPGDILVQRSNTPELVGTSARYDGPERWAIFPDLLIRLRVDESRIDGRYMAAALRSPRTHRALKSKAKGLAGSMPKIDQATIGAATIPLPDRGAQIAAIESVSAAEERVDRLVKVVHLQRARGAALRRAVLAAAFSGRLTGASTDTEIIEEMAEA